MELQEAKDRFVQVWGTLATQWGINRTMAQIHAYLMISPDSLATEDLMTQLQISRGNVSMNLRDLMDWGLVFKELRPGERKEYFFAEKDAWKVAKQVAKERRKRELEPVIKLLEELRNVPVRVGDRESETFHRTIESISRVVNLADGALDATIKAEESLILGTLIKLLR
jgi:DNA-binding transcriptional regulator GbsR (MarR family)